VVRCPVCGSLRVVIVLSAERRASCARCGARWAQEGGYQRAVRRNPSRRRAAVAGPDRSVAGSLHRSPGAGPGLTDRIGPAGVIP
jgi:ribosomal protein S27E